MNKRQKPILLVTLLLLLLGGAVGMNMFANAKPSQPGQSDEHSEEALGESRKSDTSQVTASAADALKGGDAGTPRPGPKKPGPGVSLVKPKASAYKPKPSDSATSQQWYDRDKS
jgi:hypothetical protein